MSESEVADVTMYSGVLKMTTRKVVDRFLVCIHIGVIPAMEFTNCLFDANVCINKITTLVTFERRSVARYVDTIDKESIKDSLLGVKGIDNATLELLQHIVDVFFDADQEHPFSVGILRTLLAPCVDELIVNDEQMNKLCDEFDNVVLEDRNVKDPMEI